MMMSKKFIQMLKIFNNKNMIILGIDPGSNKIGFAIIKKEKTQLKLIKYGCINNDSKITIAKQLLKTQKEIERLIKIYKPNIASVEKLFFFKNLKTAINVSQTRGVIIATLAKANIKIKEFTPLQVKQAICGYGKADKVQIQKIVKLIFKLKQIPKPDDAADAIAIAFSAIKL